METMPSILTSMKTDKKQVRVLIKEGKLECIAKIGECNEFEGGLVEDDKKNRVGENENSDIIV